MINGKDATSLEVLKALGNGHKVKELPNLFEISIDQAKRLSRYYRLLMIGQNHLTSQGYQKLLDLGLRSLTIADMFRGMDWMGIEEILSSVDNQTTRAQLNEFKIALAEKRVRIKSFQQTITTNMNVLERKKEKLELLKLELLQLKETIDESIIQFQKYSKENRDFLLDHVGIFKDSFVLIKRIDSLWYRKLKKANIIQYDSDNYVHIILNLDDFVSDLEHRLKRNGNVLWNYEKEVKRANFDVPQDPSYKVGHSLIAKDLQLKLTEIEEELQQYQNEMIQLEKKLHTLKHQPVHTFIEKVEKSNQLSDRELKKHGDLQNKAAKWLYSQGYIVVNELILPNGRRVDTIGINEDDHVVIIEVKASMNDFKQDDKWRDYLPYSDRFYFCLEQDYRHIDQSKEDAGCLVEHHLGLQVSEESKLVHACSDIKKIRYLIGRNLSKKTIYGY